MPPWKEELTCTPLMVALMLWICSGPSVMLLELIWMSLKSWLMTWVRNGNPSIDTLGFLGNPCCWISDATLLSRDRPGPEVQGDQQADQDDQHDDDRPEPVPPPGADGGVVFVSGVSVVTAGSLVDGLQLARSVVGGEQGLPARLPPRARAALSRWG